MKLSSNVVVNSCDETKFPHKLLLTDTQVLRLRKSFANGASAGQSGGFLGRLLGPLLKTGLLLMKNVLKLLTKSVLILLGLTVAASATDAAIQKKNFRSGVTTVIISNEEMDDIIKIVKFLEEFIFLIKVVSETIQNGVKRWISQHVIRYIRS